MNRFYYRPIALLLAVVFLITSTASVAQNAVPGIFHTDSAGYTKHETSPLKANTQLPFEEKEEQKEKDSTGSILFLFHTLTHRRYSLSEPPVLFEYSATGLARHVALYLAIRDLRL